MLQPSGPTFYWTPPAVEGPGGLAAAERSMVESWIHRAPLTLQEALDDVVYVDFAFSHGGLVLAGWRAAWLAG